MQGARGSVIRDAQVLGKLSPAGLPRASSIPCPPCRLAADSASPLDREWYVIYGLSLAGIGVITLCMLAKTLQGKVMLLYYYE